MYRKVLATALLLPVMISVLAGTSAHTLTKATERLAAVYQENLQSEEMMPVFIILTEQYEPYELYEEVRDLSRKERRDYTVGTLTEFSNATQQELRNLLKAMEKDGLVNNLHYLWIANVICLNLTPAALEIIDTHPDVEVIEYDPMVFALDESSFNRRNEDYRQRDSASQTREITYNVTRVNAPQVWDMGITGEDVVVAVIDTGVNYNHRDITNRMWEHPNFPYHGYNYVDNNNNPMDNNGHGTHCAGTVAGDGTAGSETGVAPGALIMALKNLDPGGETNQTMSWNSIQFAVQYGADVLSMSFGTRNPTVHIRRTYRDIMVNAMNAGVISSAAAGNDGNNQELYPIPHNVRPPGDSPPPWVHPDQKPGGGISSAVTVGATDRFDNLAHFSGRGPVTFQDVNPYNDYPYNPGPGLITPDIMAPGVDVKSLRHDNISGYTTMSGTSMATPGVAGVLALMLSHNPELTPEMMGLIIEDTAHPLSAGKSNTFGSGRIDALRAVRASRRIFIDSFQVVEPFNNIPQNGDLLNLHIVLKNVMLENAANVTAELQSLCEYITVIDNSAEFGNIQNGQTVRVNNAFSARIATNTPHRYRAAMRVVITTDAEVSWNDYVDVVVSSPFIRLDHHSFLDDNNNIPEYNEEVTIAARLRNTGGANARGVSASISTEDQYITILGNMAAFGIINQNTNSTVYDAFRVRIADNVPNGHRVWFNLTINAEGEQSWEEEFYMDVYAPVISPVIPLIYDTLPGGNNNGIADPGETLTVYLPLKNVGGADSPPVNVLIETDDERVTVNEIRYAHYNVIKKDESQFTAVNLTIAEDTPIGTPLTFTWGVTSGEYAFNGQFVVGVGGAVPVYIGAGNAVNGVFGASPVNIYLRSLRSQTVYTREELNEAGRFGTGIISMIAYHITNPPQYPLPNFIVRMKHTNAQNAAQHDAGPYTTVYQRTYTPTTGWDYITLNTPFVWNGVDNILIDTAFSITDGYSSSGQQRIYNYPNGFRFSRHDTNDQTNAVTNTVIADKPQISMMIGTVYDYPDRPRNLAATLVSPLRVTLNWETPAPEERNSLPERSSRRNDGRSNDLPAYRNPVGYNIYRNGVKINSQPVTALTYNHTTGDFNPPYDYFYYVNALYEDEQESLSSNIVKLEYKLFNPTFNRTEGMYSEPFNLIIQSPISGAAIYYTLDESEPNTEANLYQEPVFIDRHSVIRAKAYKEGWTESEISRTEYRMLFRPRDVTTQTTASSVTLFWEEPYSPERNRDVASNVSAEQTAITTRTALKSRRDFARNVSETSYNSPARTLIGYNVYRSGRTGAFTLLNDEPLTAREYYDGELERALYRYNITAVYDEGESHATDAILVGVGVVVPPVLSPHPGIYDHPVDLMISCNTDDAIIYYTLDNTQPSTASPVFGDDPVTLRSTTTVRAFAKRAEWDDSEFVQGVYTVNISHAEDEVATPTVTRLLNAYPNPFNPETYISFSLASAEQVLVDIYDISGRRIAILAEGYFDAGEHGLVWNGRDDGGRQVSSGIYFYRMKTPVYQQVKKVLLLK